MSGLGRPGPADGAWLWPSLSCSIPHRSQSGPGPAEPGPRDPGPGAWTRQLSAAGPCIRSGSDQAGGRGLLTRISLSVNTTVPAVIAEMQPRDQGILRKYLAASQLEITRDEQL